MVSLLNKRPHIRIKIAASLDGVTALNNGASQWITSEAARQAGHRWRARAQAILTGIGTILADDPRLDVRPEAPLRGDREGDLLDALPPSQPDLVVLDSHLRTPVNARIFTGKRKVLIYAATENPERKRALEAAGAQVFCVPDQCAPKVQVALSAVLSDLCHQGIHSVHVEAGATLNGALISAGWVDEIICYLAPAILGQGRGMAHFEPLTALAQGLALEWVSVLQVGPDLELVARVLAVTDAGVGGV